MLTRIVHNSEHLCGFFDQLQLTLYKPQRQHILNMADALVVCEDKKTLAALQRQFVDAPDASNMADCLRISPWQADDVRAALRAQQVAWALAQAERTGAPKVIYLNLDDSLGEKHKTTRHLEPVDFHHDHNDSTKRQPRYKNGFCYLVCTVRIGQIVVTVDLRLYLRAKTVRRINRHRTAEQRIPFRSKNTVARSILEALRLLLPKGWPIYVQFDSWYASARLLKYVRRQGWHVTCGLKSNRKLNGVRIDHLASALRHQRYMRVRVTATDGNTTTYYVRTTTGRLSDVPYEVRVFFSKRHPRGRASAYFLSTDHTRSAHQALQGYGGRWSCEVDNFYLKTRLGLADFRVRSYEAVDRYMVVVHLAWGYIERRFVQERSAQVKCYGDIIRRHQEEHARAWLTSALQMVLETGAIEPVLQRFLRETV
jgi:DDE superfamily endonuclease